MSIQEFTSKNTSINKTKIPQLFKRIEKFGDINIDLGGGRYDNVTEFLATIGVDNYVFDPHNRSQDHNEKVMNVINKRIADTVTCANVLNVIKEKEVRATIIDLAQFALRKNGKAYFWIYEGDDSGIPCESMDDCWQNNCNANFYVKEIERCFNIEKRNKHMIVGINNRLNNA